MDSKGKKILIVDDDENLCEILQYNLGHAGYDTEVAHSAEEAVKRELDSFDLILLDVMMGPMSGFKFADKLLDAGVAVIPGSPFGPSGGGCVRMSYGAAGIEGLKEAMDRVEAAI